MTETMKIRLINAYANLLDVFAKNSKELKEYIGGNGWDKNNFDNICETITYLGNEIQSIKFNNEIKVEVKINESNNDEH